MSSFVSYEQYNQSCVVATVELGALLHQVEGFRLTQPELADKTAQIRAHWRHINELLGEGPIFLEKLNQRIEWHEGLGEAVTDQIKEEAKQLQETRTQLIELTQEMRRVASVANELLLQNTCSSRQSTRRKGRGSTGFMAFLRPGALIWQPPRSRKAAE